MSRKLQPCWAEGSMPEPSGMSFHVVSWTQSDLPLNAMSQELRRFWVLAASQYIPLRGRSSCTETGCIHLRPSLWIWPTRPTGEVAPVRAGLFHCGLRTPQLPMPYVIGANAARHLISFCRVGTNATGAP